jgi:hypothetical protein
MKPDKNLFYRCSYHGIFQSAIEGYTNESAYKLDRKLSLADW